MIDRDEITEMEEAIKKAIQTEVKRLLEKIDQFTTEATMHLVSVEERENLLKEISGIESMELKLPLEKPSVCPDFDTVDLRFKILGAYEYSKRFSLIAEETTKNQDLWSSPDLKLKDCFLDEHEAVTYYSTFQTEANLGKTHEEAVMFAWNIIQRQRQSRKIFRK